MNASENTTAPQPEVFHEYARHNMLRQITLAEIDMKRATVAIGDKEAQDLLKSASWHLYEAFRAIGGWQWP
ncbi:hypothetical protein DDJ71_19795 [Mycobacteroides abscessus]|uniref:hypothetical protein n=1 Tax=Mycobacteroides abscessus TaxID=36809 RepID=UPI000D3E825D|nr:hypothetical protein [Mycobacteroides abscessus]PVB16430.1 hypothetical protein DDJ71_19795 [Mycobacteroides abscessus]